MRIQAAGQHQKQFVSPTVTHNFHSSCVCLSPQKPKCTHTGVRKCLEHRRNSCFEIGAARGGPSGVCTHMLVFYCYGMGYSWSRRKGLPGRPDPLYKTRLLSNNNGGAWAKSVGPRAYVRNTFLLYRICSGRWRQRPDDDRQFRRVKNWRNSGLKTK